MDTDTAALQMALGSSVAWVFADASAITPYQGNVWIRDPETRRRLGSGSTSDPAWADATMNYLDGLVAAQGPFDGMVGYSQGGAMTVLYAAQRPSYLSFILTFCGFLTDNHYGLRGLVTANSPYTMPAFFYAGSADTISTPAMVQAAKSHFTGSVYSEDGGGHAVPTSGPSFDAAVSFIQGQTAGR